MERIHLLIIAAAAAALVLIIIAVVLIIRGRREEEAEEENAVERPPQEQKKPRERTLQLMDDTEELILPADIEIGNLQGIGSRTEQQDAFGLSPIADYDKNGLFAVLCDGMGGMENGGPIANDAVRSILSVFPWQGDSAIITAIQNLTRKVYKEFGGSGGTTLVAVRIASGELSFWSVGDSDLFLLRNQELYALNQRQEYRNVLLRRVLEGQLTIEEAYSDPQAPALSEYIGSDRVRPDYTKHGIRLKPGDVVFLCSDGVSDTLELEEIRQLLSMPAKPDVIARNLEQAIIREARPNQDNYTGIILRYRFSQEPVPEYMEH